MGCKMCCRQLAGGKAPDSYIKLVLVNTNGQEMGRAKTSLRRAQSNPLFKETFMFQVKNTCYLSKIGRNVLSKYLSVGF